MPGEMKPNPTRSRGAIVAGDFIWTAYLYAENEEMLPNTKVRKIHAQTQRAYAHQTLPGRAD